MADTTYFAAAIANGKYAKLRQLDRAVPDATEFVNLLKTDHGFTTVLLDDRLRGSLWEDIDRELSAMRFQGGSLVLLWNGHGEFGPDGQLRLMGRSSETSDAALATAAQLGEWAARTGAAQVLVIVDTCYSGSGVVSTLEMANAVIAGRANPGGAWFGVLAASQRDELARSGALFAELRRLLSEGPRDEILRLRWSTYDARVRGDDVIDAVVKEWSDPRQSPQPATTGSAWPMLRNPLHRPNSPHRVVEHLLQAARGTSTDQSFFTGREGVLDRIVAWIGRATPGACVVTGPAGSGKSAIVGRIVSLSSADERQRLLAVENIDTRLDPGVDCVSAHLHCRGLDVKATVENLVEQLHLEPGAGTYDLLAFAARRRAAGKPLVIVLDGLDEAGDTECRDVALQVVQPLSREALILVGTREVPGAVGQPGLLALLGAAGETIDLGRLVDDTLKDVRRYIVRRLAGVSMAMEPEAVAEELVRAAGRHDPAADGPFLLARLVTSQLRREPVDTGREGWQARLATSVATALERDLESTVLTVSGEAHPTAARELLRALACAHGSGFPPDDVWPIVATTLSPSGTTYTRDDVYSLLIVLGRHVVASAEGDQAVYRLAHQRLVDHLRPIVDTESGSRLQPGDALALAQAIAAVYESLLDQGQSPKQHTYLWRYSWRHFADAGVPGIELMRRFVERDRQVFLPDLALVLARVGVGSWQKGSPQDAVTLHKESVEIRRELKEPQELALALFNLSFALGSAGDSDAADEAASEASDLARGMSDEPKTRGLLAAALTAHTLALFRRGNLLGAVRIAEEALALSEAELSKNGKAAPLLVAALLIAANAAHVLGRHQQADEWSRRALSLFEAQHQDSAQEQSVLLELLAVRALIELAELIRAGGNVPPDAAPPSAGARILAIYRKHGASGTVSDILIAEGIRLLATTIALEASTPRAQADAPNPVALLDEACALLTPMVPRNVDAILALAANRVARVRLIAASDPAGAITDLLEIESQIRPHVSILPVAQLLGQVLHLQVLLSTAIADPDILIKKEQEAVRLARRSPYGFGGMVTIDIYQHLIQLLEANGRAAEAIAARMGAAEVMRLMQDGSPLNAVRLAGLLSDIAVGIYQPRPLEALELTSEALTLLEPLDQTLLPVRIIHGACLLNRSVTMMALARFSEAQKSLERVVTLLDIESPTPQTSAWLGAALHNLGALFLEAGDNAAALDRATRALTILTPLDDPQSTALMPFVRINLGRALRAGGSVEEGTRMLKAGITELRARPMSDDLQVAAFASSLDAAGSAMWDEVLAGLTDQPALVRTLEILRTRPVEELSETIRILRSRLEEPDTGKDVRVVRTIARRNRSRHGERFDALWTEAIGALPAWLTVNPSLEDLLVAWWNAPTWRQSRDYLAANPVLLDPGTDVLIDEFRLAGIDEDLASKHLGLLSEARTNGVEQAYAPVLAQLALQEWRLQDFSSEHLTAHVDDLLSPGTQAFIDARSTDGDMATLMLGSILTLARRGEQAVAYRAARENAFGISLLQTAIKAADAERAAALAIICLNHDDLTAADRAFATTALAIASALRGRPAEALTRAQEVAALEIEPTERTRLVEMVAEAIGRQPAQRDTLLSVLGTLSVPSRPGAAGDDAPSAV